MKGNEHLTEEQNAQRLKGLRILARIIVRAHLTSQLNGTVEGKDSPGDPDGELIVNEVHRRDEGNVA